MSNKTIEYTPKDENDARGGYTIHFGNYLERTFKTSYSSIIE
jgi:hypothetical protein